MGPAGVCAVIRQGIEKVHSATDFPDQATEISLYMITALGDNSAKLSWGTRREPLR